MSDARSEILTRIRQSLPKAYLPSAGVEVPSPPPSPEFEETLVEVFVQALKAAQGVVHLVGNQDEARDFLVAEFRKIGVTQVLSWDTIYIPISDLEDAFGEEGINLFPVFFLGQIEKLIWRNWNLSRSG